MRDTDGLNLAQLAHTTAMAYQFALGDKEPSWPLPDDGSSENWPVMVGLCAQAIERADNLKWEDLAKFAMETFSNQMGSGQRWEGLSPELKVAWEAMVRHLANMVDIDEDDQPEKHEGYWFEWAKNRKSKLVTASA